jgi:hypothetical protein
MCAFVSYSASIGFHPDYCLIFPFQSLHGILTIFSDIHSGEHDAEAQRHGILCHPLTAYGTHTRILTAGFAA